MRRTFHRYAGKALVFLGIEFDGETTLYETFAVHRDARVRVLDEKKELKLDLFGSILEKDGRFKLFSHLTD